MGANLTIFESALSSMVASATAMSVASNNIANVNTPGYSRQRVTFSAKLPQTSGGIEVGRGVDVSQVERIVSEYAELRITSSVSTMGQHEASAENLKQVEALMNELGQPGLTQFMADFFNAFHDVSNDASARTPRLNVLNKAAIVVDRFHKLSEGLINARALIDVDIRARVDRINTIAEELASINERVSTADEQTQLGLRDQRTVLVQELAQYVDVNFVETTSGEFQVYIAQGLQLIAGTTRATLSTQPDGGNDGLVDVLITSGSGSGVDMSSRINGGELLGLLTTRDTTIPGYQSGLDETAYEFATEVNTIHLTGFGLDSAGARRFFGTLAAVADSASNISIDAAVDGIPDAIAAASAAAQIPSGNSIARTIAELQNASIVFTTGTTTFAGFYSDVLADVGNDTSSAIRQATFSEDVLRQAKMQRERISGVSLEEEQSNLLRFQAAFQAASRMIAVADDVLRQLTELLG